MDQVQARALNLSPVAFQCFILGIAVPTTVAASYLFFLAFERPFLSLRTSATGLD